MGPDHGGQSEQYVHQAYTELSPLTGLYYNRAFFKKADELLQSMEPDKNVLVAMDLVHFRLFNKLYGRDEGDKVLISVAEVLRGIQDTHGGVAGYLGGDNFCILMPDDEQELKELEENVLGCLRQYNNALSFYPVFGVYSVNDVTQPAVVMYDHATMAISKATGTYANRMCRYDSGMEEKIEAELNLLAEIQIGLEKEEFTFYAQPQCDIATGKIVGAESLVRWKHGRKGLVSPGLFVPLLERNGLIAELDRYVWRKVCQWLRSWIDRGYRPVPISINISRMDIFSMNVPEYLMELMREYRLPERLLKVEITEGAYVEDEEEINKTVKKLREYGFTVMMDDFGSGYSSLNMLKSVVVDVLKLDMRFLDIGEKDEDKGIGIIESVVNMARLMGLPIIVEGVENQRQEKFLLQLGCRYTQGYYYYRPLPIDRFEELLSDERRLDYDGLRCRQVESVRMRELLDGNMYTDAMVNNMLGAMAFYDVFENQVEITRVNEQYYAMTGITTKQEDGVDKRIGSHIRDDDKQKLLTIFEKAYDEPAKGASGYLHYMRTDGKVLWIYFRAFFLNEKDGHRMYYGSLVDMTEEQVKEKKTSFLAGDLNDFNEKMLRNMEEYYGDMPYGYAVGKLVLDVDNDPIDYMVLYANKQMENICGGNVDKFRQIISHTFSSNPEELLAKAYAAAFLDETVDHFTYSDISNRYLQLTFHQYEYGYAGCIVTDVTHMHIYEEALNGIMSSYREVYYLDVQDNYFRMIYPEESNMLERGDYEESINRHFGMGKILDYNQQNIRRFLSLENIRSELKHKDSIELRYRRSAPDTPDEWCLTTIKVSERENGVPKTAVMVIKSIESLLREEERKRGRNMAEALANMAEGFFIYRASGDGEILYANPKVLKIYGCNTMDEFNRHVHNSFKGMIHPEDLARVRWEISDQISHSEGQMDYIRYRIKRKDGQIRWVDDYGHLVDSGSGDGERLFYVFITDITDEITFQQQEKLLNQNKFY